LRQHGTHNDSSLFDYSKIKKGYFFFFFFRGRRRKKTSSNSTEKKIEDRKTGLKGVLSERKRKPYLITYLSFKIRME
jgi:hypothetical protein